MAKYTSLSCIKKHEKRAARLGVSQVARSSRGFLTAYKRAGGKASRLPDRWKRKREAFIARHMAQVRKRREKLYDSKGQPTRRHLALLMWAYTPARGCPVR